jgi:prepilin-type N-terminal cleavage/methylation domain-containing protein
MHADRPIRSATQGFTLVELLVVIAIIAILATLSFVVSTSMIANARKTASINNLRQLHIAAESFAGDNAQIYPATYWGDPDAGINKVYWWTALGPYLYSDYDGKINGIFRDKADPAVAGIDEGDWRWPKWTEISYTPWSNGTANRGSLRGISAARTDRLSGQPYLTTGKNLGTWAIAGEGAYNTYVKSSAEWRKDGIIVLYCNGSIKTIKNPTFAKVAPAMATSN